MDTLLASNAGSSRDAASAVVTVSAVLTCVSCSIEFEALRTLEVSLQDLTRALGVVSDTVRDDFFEATAQVVLVAEPAGPTLIARRLAGVGLLESVFTGQLVDVAFKAVMTNRTCGSARAHFTSVDRLTSWTDRSLRTCQQLRYAKGLGRTIVACSTRDACLLVRRGLELTILTRNIGLAVSGHVARESWPVVTAKLI